MQTSRQKFFYGAAVCGLVLLMAGSNGAVANPGARDIRQLSPFQLYAVPPVIVAPPVPLPPPSDVVAGTGILPPEPTDDPADYDFFWHQNSFEAWRQARWLTSSTPDKQAVWKRDRSRRSVWLPRSSDDRWTFGASNWKYAGEDGLDVTLGSNQIAAPDWSHSARMAGVSLTQSPRPVAETLGDWHYSVAVGALDYSTDRQQGDLVYGPTATNTVVRYEASPRLGVEAQLETAPSLVTSGFGAKYEMSAWGSVYAGASRASYGQQAGWKYQAGYEVTLLDKVKLSWLSESNTAGYADLGRYRDVGSSLAGRRRQFGATVPLGRWGDVGTTYEDSSTSMGDVKRRFGFTQQLWYSPNLLVGLKAEREIHSGDYDIGLNLSVPIH